MTLVPTANGLRAQYPVRRATLFNTQEQNEILRISERADLLSTTNIGPNANEASYRQNIVIRPELEESAQEDSSAISGSQRSPR
jgi:hypothetical protein